MCQTLQTFWQGCLHTTYERVSCEDSQQPGHRQIPSPNPIVSNGLCPPCWFINHRAFTSQPSPVFQDVPDVTGQTPAGLEWGDPLRMSPHLGRPGDAQRHQRGQILPNVAHYRQGPQEQAAFALAEQMQRNAAANASTQATLLITPGPARLPAPHDVGSEDRIDISISNLLAEACEDINEEFTIDDIFEMHEARQERLGRRPWLRRHFRAGAIFRLYVEGGPLSADEQDCPVCAVGIGTEHAQAGVESVVKLPCGHKFGDYCIQRWLCVKNTCPICRRNYSQHLTDPRSGRVITFTERPELRVGYARALARSDKIQDDMDEDERRTMDSHLQGTAVAFVMLMEALERDLTADERNRIVPLALRNINASAMDRTGQPIAAAISVGEQVELAGGTNALNEIMRQAWGRAS